jgi:hypothetical protein
MIDKTKEEYLRRLAERNVIPFEPPHKPNGSNPSRQEGLADEAPEYQPEAKQSIAVLDDERQRRLPAIAQAIEGGGAWVPDLAEGPLCGTPLLDEPLRRNTPRISIVGGRSWPLTALAYAFFALGVGINISNAPPPPDGLLPMAMGVLAEGVMFWLPAHALTLPPLRKIIAVVLLAGLVVPFALVNSLRMASIVSADLAMARSDRVTAAIRDAEGALGDTRVARDTECRKNGPLCRQRQADVVVAERKIEAARVPVVAIARPESADFARLVGWATRGLVIPSEGDFGTLWLLLRTLLPQIGGVVLLLARR